MLRQLWMARLALCLQALEKAKAGTTSPGSPSPSVHRLARVSTVAEDGEQEMQGQAAIPKSAFETVAEQQPEQVSHLACFDASTCLLQALQCLAGHCKQRSPLWQSGNCSWYS